MTEENIMSRLGGFRNLLQSQPPLPDFCIDLSDTIWADAAALLNTLCVIASYKQPQTAIITRLGLNNTSREHLIFLKFLALQGFFDIFAAHTKIEVEVGQSASVDSAALKQSLASYPESTLLPNADCIKAQLIDCEKYVGGREAFRALIGDLIHEARTRSWGPTFGGDALIRERLFQKLRRVLHELLANAVLHAYRGPNTGFAGLFARIHYARPFEREEARRWDQTFTRERNVPAISQFDPNKNADWLELFVCDSGVGLCHDLPVWASKARSRPLRELFNRALRRHHPLYVIAPQVFKAGMSREERLGPVHSAVTGLVHLDSVFANDRDFSRIYTAGTFLGSHHPWEPRSSGSRRILKGDVKRCCPGTTYAIALHAPRQLARLPSHWVAPTEGSRRAILERLRGNLHYTEIPGIVAFDQVNDLDPLSPDAETDDRLHQTDSIVVLRLPETASKNNFSSWIQRWGGISSSSASWSSETFILCDIPLFQAAAWVDLLPSIQMPQHLSLRVFIVSTEWHVACLLKTPGNTRFKSSVKHARDFLNERNTSNRFGAPSLAELVRYMDSVGFWKESAELPVSDLLRSEAIIWHNSLSGEVTEVQGYMDLAHAIAEPVKLSACKRAMHRTLTLFPGCRPLAADDITRSVLSDFHFDQKQLGSTEKQAHVVVGSVCVTSGTIRRYYQRPALNVAGTITVLVHPNSKDTGSITPALLWLPQSSTTVKPPSETSYERIPFTPFIGRGGDRAISIARFESSSSSDPFERPFFPRNPQQMYSDFNDYGVLKTGHWRYGSRHELITVNLSLALEYAVVERGELVNWLAETLDQLLSSVSDNSEPAAAIVYLSHEVTDKLVGILRRLDILKNKVSADRLIPLRTFGSKTVSPMLFSPLTRERVSKAFARIGTPASGVILDDGIVTGKSIREIEEFLLASGARRVFTVAILDRYGSPIHEELMPRYIQKHRRYWRWDVPTLGHSRDCVMCAALGRARAFAADVSSGLQLARLREWQSLWSARDVSTGWPVGGAKPIALSPNIKITFGRRLAEDGAIFKNTVEVTNSTSLAALIMELTRLTSKAEVAIKRANAIVEHAKKGLEAARAIDTAIEIVAAQYLLFFDELDYWQKRDRLKLLIELVWHQAHATQMTALAGLCVSLGDGEMLSEVWRWLHAEVLSREIAPNIDALLMTGMLWRRVSEEFGSPTRHAANSTPCERTNLFMAGISRGIRPAVAALFEIVGDSAGAAHGTSLRTRLNRLADSPRRASQEVQELLQGLAHDCQKLQEALSALAYGSGPDGLRPASDDSKRLARILAMLPCDPARGAIEWARDLRTFIFGSDSVDGLARRYHQALLRELDDETHMGTLLDPTIGQLQQNWPRIVAEKFNGDIPMHWRAADGQIRLPTIRCASIRTWPRRTTVYFDPHVAATLHDVLANVIYAEDQIKNPWNQPPTTDADLWWLPTLRDTHLQIECMNKTSENGISLGMRVALAGLERMGGSVEARIEGDRARVAIKIPLLSSLVVGRSA